MHVTATMLLEPEGGREHAESVEEGVRIAHRYWPNAGVPGELSQVLPSPRHFEQASQLVTKQMTADSVACGPDVEAHLASLMPAVEAGFEEVYVANMGPSFRDMIREYGASVLPELRTRAGQQGR